MLCFRLERGVRMLCFISGPLVPPMLSATEQLAQMGRSEA